MRRGWKLTHPVIQKLISQAYDHQRPNASVEIGNIAGGFQLTLSAISKKAQALELSINADVYDQIQNMRALYEAIVSLSSSDLKLLEIDSGYLDYIEAEMAFLDLTEETFNSLLETVSSWNEAAEKMASL